ncbi:MAG: LIM domain-containing protein [Candidatus Krumholzibacteria bacterium]|nr:LIM domain-containing protein [Candidatus Krumholzibacteria bacterium]MDH4335998.1 LIM domain-containing protein [Candidatus Krumholzibacteria bacterium]
MRFLLIAFLLLAVLAGAASAQESPGVCASCGEPIDGPYFTTKGLSYHANHFRCAHCDLAISGSYSEYQGKVYHNDCFRDHVALRCSLCNATITGEYLQDYWGNSYCQHHDGVAPVCDSCGRFISEPLTGGGVRYDDGRFVCNVCRPKSITDVGEILTLVNEVAGHMKAFGMNVDYEGVQIHLVGREKMQKLSGHHSDGLRGFTDYREQFRLLGYSRGRRMNMYLLYGMPRMEIISTIAHELAHIWQFNQGQFKSERAWSEGSCNYAAFLVLAQYPGRESSFFRVSLTRDGDDVYGDGFRRVKTLAEAEGAGTWLRYLSKDRQFPPGY